MSAGSGSLIVVAISFIAVDCSSDNELCTC